MKHEDFERYCDQALQVSRVTLNTSLSDTLGLYNIVTFDIEKLKEFVNSNGWTLSSLKHIPIPTFNGVKYFVAYIDLASHSSDEKDTD